MKLGIMQPYFLPYIGYWQLLNAVDKYVIYDDVNYIKGGWINRNYVLVNGKKYLFTIKLLDSSSFKKINEIELNMFLKDKDKLFKTIEQGYKKAPFFAEGIALFKKILYFDEKNLSKFIINSIKEVCRYLEINTELIVSSEIDKNNSLKGEEKVLNICQVLGGTEYYNAIGGQELYSNQSFDEKGIKLKFLETGNVSYKQFSDTYIQNLSILDVVMFSSKDDIKKMLEMYSLKEN